MKSFASVYLPLFDHPNKIRIENMIRAMESWKDMIIMMHRFDNHFTYTSNQVKDVLGYDETVWDNDFVSAITHEDDIFGINEKMAGYLMEANKPFYDKEGPYLLKLFGRLRHANGRYIPVEFSGVILQYDRKGGFYLGLGVYQDISARAGNESQKKKSEKLTNSLERNLLTIKKLYFEMYPVQSTDEVPLVRNKGVSKIHIIDTEQLSIKTQYIIEIQKILSKEIGHDSILVKNEHNATRLQFLNNVIYCIEQHIENVEFSTDHLAHELSMSRGNLYRKTRQVLQVSPAELIKRIRLNKAAYLLKVTEESVNGVAFKVGFVDSSYFSKCFRGMYGMTPLAYRRSSHDAG